MVLGIPLPAFILLHTALSVFALLAGLLILLRMLMQWPLGLANLLFLLTTIAANVSGLLLPSASFGPGHVVGVISLVALAAACAALWLGSLYGYWRLIYVVGAVAAVALNFLVAITQLFTKLPALVRLAPTGTEALVVGVQAASLLLFALLGYYAARRFRPGGM